MPNINFDPSPLIDPFMNIYSAHTNLCKEYTDNFIETIRLLQKNNDQMNNYYIIIHMDSKYVIVIAIS